MAQMMPFKIGADASCSDGARGQVSRIIVNPVSREVTHLAVDPKYRRGQGRLVPVDLVDGTTGQVGTLLIHLGLTKNQVKDLPPVDIDHAAG